VTGLEFLRPNADGAVARSPMERNALAAGARMAVREGWNVAVAYGEGEREALGQTVGWVDVSHVTKVEVRGGHELAPGLASRTDGTWWCPVTRERTLVVGDAGDLAGDHVEVTTALAALTIAGPLSRELFARFCALDLRAQAMPVGGFRPGSVARTPGYVLREDEDRFLMLFGWALGEYMWTVVADAAEGLGGGPVGIDALAREIAPHA
jgi:glycine cleavage system aminomethyltransferase T